MNLSLGRQQLAAVATNGKVVFAGGDTVTTGGMRLVDIYEVNSNSWTTAQWWWSWSHGGHVQYGYRRVVGSQYHDRIS